ncbi:MAG: hypothetical protein KHZ62_02535 [Clostridiales bacterium]|nr:hypothetical protein [Clostridiales bacterium]
MTNIGKILIFAIIYIAALLASQHGFLTPKAPYMILALLASIYCLIDAFTYYKKGEKNKSVKFVLASFFITIAAYFVFDR